MLLVDEVKDYYPIKGHCPQMFCSAVAHIKVGAISAVIAVLEPPTVLSISLEQKRILAICKMVPLDEVKDYYRYRYKNRFKYS